MARDEFPQDVKAAVARRVNYLCSKPECRVQTVGPHTEPIRSINVGTVSHITAAAPSGPRFDPTLTPEQRRSFENAIWLCGTHAREVDTDTTRFTAFQLRTWKREAERDAEQNLGRRSSGTADDAAVEVAKAALRDQRIERLMRAYNGIGSEGVERAIRSFTDLSQEEQAEMFDMVRAGARAGRLPKRNPFRSSV